jgi:hypothetical protein
LEPLGERNQPSPWWPWRFCAGLSLPHKRPL